ncbi:uncharacterized protein FOMMEDRAFT_161459 [Fomitiporia mediterranea MF3/22]|uniref:uncharacterized protein n=1 Tax=Fomitiporia mediterranea (strain MF3/22) TaxID=694068 RepID=UPI0004407CC9|nr:uncharacterized protein FOMMEDRAFT_161459 [Fomitiporia mediterranea MF3/22]EJC98633.1 hypothetical protein FOMMEDRAFT_161459 [Fomitiporia mediterranea MF3/22]
MGTIAAASANGDKASLHQSLVQLASFSEYVQRSSQTIPTSSFLRTSTSLAALALTAFFFHPLSAKSRPFAAMTATLVVDKFTHQNIRISMHTISVPQPLVLKSLSFADFGEYIILYLPPFIDSQALFPEVRRRPGIRCTNTPPNLTQEGTLL